MPLRINGDLRHALAEHYPQLGVYMTYLLVSLTYRAHFLLLRRVHVVEEFVEVSLELGAVVHQITIVQRHVREPVRLHLRVIVRRLLDEPMRRHACGRTPDD